MSSIAKCTSCGQDGVPGSMFCKQCGGRLAYDPSATPGRRAGGGCSKAISRVIRLLVLAIVSLVLLAVLIPVKPAGAVGSREDANACRERLGKFSGQVKNGMPTSMSFSESQLNAYLVAVIEYAQANIEEKPLQIMVEDVNLAFTPEAFTGVMTSQVGPLKLSYLVAGHPESQEENGVSWKYDRVQLGHLPIPGFLHGPLVSKLKKVFQDMEDERELLESVKSVDLTAGEVELVHQ